jgi:prophage DNA circulation protein
VLGCCWRGSTGTHAGPCSTAAQLTWQPDVQANRTAVLCTGNAQSASAQCSAGVQVAQGVAKSRALTQRHMAEVHGRSAQSPDAAALVGELHSVAEAIVTAAHAYHGGCCLTSGYMSPDMQDQLLRTHYLQ